MVSRAAFYFAAAVTALMVAGIGGVARAATSPCGTSGNYHDYAFLTGHVQYGAASDLSTYKPALCGSSSASFAWVAEEDPSSTGIVQIGYVNAGSGSGFEAGWHVFDEKKKCSDPINCPPFFNYWPAPSGTNSYKVGYDSTQSRFDLWYNGTQMDHTVWDPTLAWGSPFDATWSGETLHCESDVPGTLATPVEFSDVKRKGSDGTWATGDNLDLSPFACASNYQNAWVDEPNSFQIATANSG